MAASLEVDDFLAAQRSRGLPIFDVRTPAEFAQGHVPGAINLPLFTNEERAEIGTLYKKQGPQAAQLLGLERVGPRLRSMAEAGLARAKEGEVLVHCWRGGMRSSSVAWLFEFSGLKASTLKGGYKFFRRRVLAEFEKPRRIRVLGGYTGSDKTGLLGRLAEKGHAVIDLEALAHHRGSAFGALGLPPQPTTEQFENLLAMKLFEIPAERELWLEDESRKVGINLVPAALFARMSAAPLVFVKKTRAERAAFLGSLYGALSKDGLVQSTRKIRNKLGGEREAKIVDLIETGRLVDAADLLLDYYDKAYQFGLDRLGERERRDLTEAEILELPVK